MTQMGYSTRFTSKIAVVLLWATTSGAAFAADTTIHVSLWDKGPDSVMLDDMHQMGMGMAMTDKTMALMGLTTDLERDRFRRKRSLSFSGSLHIPAG